EPTLATSIPRPTSARNSRRLRFIMIGVLGRVGTGSSYLTAGRYTAVSPAPHRRITRPESTFRPAELAPPRWRVALQPGGGRPGNRSRSPRPAVVARGSSIPWTEPVSKTTLAPGTRAATTANDESPRQ